MTNETTPQDGKAMSPASAGSQPVAWRVYADDGSETVFLYYELARAAADEWNWSVQPLYRQPTLTDEDREAIRFASVVFGMGERSDIAATLRGLLERLT